MPWMQYCAVRMCFISSGALTTMQRLGRAPWIPIEGSPARLELHVTNKAMIHSWTAGRCSGRPGAPWGWESAIPALWQLGEGSPRMPWWHPRVTVPPQEEQKWRGWGTVDKLLWSSHTATPNYCPQSANSLPIILFTLTRELASHSKISLYFNIKCKIFRGSSPSPPEEPKLLACKSLSKPLTNYQIILEQYLGTTANPFTGNFWWIISFIPGTFAEETPFKPNLPKDKATAAPQM